MVADKVYSVEVVCENTCVYDVVFSEMEGCVNDCYFPHSIFVYFLLGPYIFDKDLTFKNSNGC